MRTSPDGSRNWAYSPSLDNNCADLSFVFTPDSGDVRNLQLGGEYLAIFETAGGTPYGPSHHAHGDNRGPVTEDESALAVAMGRRLAQAALRLAGDAA